MVDSKRITRFEKKQVIEDVKIGKEFQRIAKEVEIKERSNNNGFDSISNRPMEDIVKENLSKLEKFNKQLKVFWINREISDIIPFIAGEITLLCAISGQGKTSTNAAATATVIENGGKVCVFSNEEDMFNFHMRLFSLWSQAFYFSDWAKKKITLTEKEVQSFYDQYSDRLANLTFISDNSVTRHAENLIENLKKVDQTGDYNLIVIDYLQAIKMSNTSKDDALVVNHFAAMLQDYVRGDTPSNKATTPILLLAQLRNIGTDEKDRKVKDRIEYSRTEVKNVAGTIVEVYRPIPNCPVSVFYVDKDRFGGSNSKVTCEFKKGNFITINKERYNRLKLDAIAQCSEDDESEEAE
jgi:hypothetical protein